MRHINNASDVWESTQTNDHHHEEEATNNNNLLFNKSSMSMKPIISALKDTEVPSSPTNTTATLNNTADLKKEMLILRDRKDAPLTKLSTGLLTTYLDINEVKTNKRK